MGEAVPARWVPSELVPCSTDLAELADAIAGGSVATRRPPPAKVRAKLAAAKPPPQEGELGFQTASSALSWSCGFEHWSSPGDLRRREALFAAIDPLFVQK